MKSFEQNDLLADQTKELAGGVDLGPIIYHSRRRVRAAGSADEIAIRLANTNNGRNSASMVVNRQYSARGYGSSHVLPIAQNLVTFTASSKNEVFGTITLVADSEEGLAAEKTFPKEIASLRNKDGKSLCELTKFAFDPSPDSRPFLASLFHIVYLYGSERFSSSDLLIEVNPRHVRFYEIMLGFEKIGGIAVNEKVKAPSQLLHISVAEIGRRIERCSADARQQGRSLYPHFFRGAEEEGVRRRVASFARSKSQSFREIDKLPQIAA